MGSQKNLTILQHAATGEVYYTKKNPKKLAAHKLKLKKYSPKLNKHVMFEEVKKVKKAKGVKANNDDNKKAKSPVKDDKKGMKTDNKQVKQKEAK